MHTRILSCRAATESSANLNIEFGVGLNKLTGAIWEPQYLGAITFGRSSHLGDHLGAICDLSLTEWS